MKKYVITGCILLCSLFSFAAGNYKGIYVDNFSYVLGNIPAEDSLLSYAQHNGFTTLSLYKLHNVNQAHDLTQVASSQILADFINKAKTQYGILEVTAIGENYNFFANVISKYNQIHPQVSQQFDVYNLEFEFWVTSEVTTGGVYCTDYLTPNGYPCTIDGAYDFYITQLHKMDSLAHLDGCISETYVGWPDSLQAVGMLPEVDRILLHAYVTNPNNAYGYTDTRLSYYGSTADTAKIIIIYESEPSFLGPWLTTHYEDEMDTIYMNDYNADNAPWQSNINRIGYQWFDYSDMPYVWHPVIVGVNNIAQEQFSIRNSNRALFIETNGSVPYTVEIYDITGRVIKAETINGRNASIPLSDLSTGIYIATAKNERGTVVAQKRIFISE